MKIVIIIAFLLISTVLFGQTNSFTIVFLNKKTDNEPLPKEQLTKIMEGHLANITRLHNEGKLLAAGPFDGGGGIFILNTTSIDEAKQWISMDPGVQAKRWNIEILPYRPTYGSICPVVEPYEMTTYQLVRFDAVVSKFTAGNYPQIIKRHSEYLSQFINSGIIITSAVFGENDGGILVVRTEIQKDKLEADPGVQEGLLDFQIKKLYIAKGSFCER